MRNNTNCKRTCIHLNVKCHFNKSRIINHIYFDDVLLLFLDVIFSFLLFWGDTLAWQWTIYPVLGNFVCMVFHCRLYLFYSCSGTSFPVQCFIYLFRLLDIHSALILLLPLDFWVGVGIRLPVRGIHQSSSTPQGDLGFKKDCSIEPFFDFCDTCVKKIRFIM